MRYVTATALAVASLAACGSGNGNGSGTAEPRTTLTVTFRPSQDAAATVRTLRCEPPGGTVARPARACARLADIDTPFAPLRKGLVCTEIYGGPQTARVTGTYRGRRIWARFNRRNGCEIDRWNRHAFLFPGGAARGPS
jgi:Subtilisin inhibitor-like